MTPHLLRLPCTLLLCRRRPRRAVQQLAEALLEQVCRAPLMQLEPLTLIRKLPEGMAVAGLKTYVRQILAQASNQLQLTDGCMRVAQSDAAAPSMQANHKP